VNWNKFKTLHLEDDQELHYDKDSDRVYILSKSETSRLSPRINSSTGYKRVYYNKIKDWYYWQINVDHKTTTRSNFTFPRAAADDLDTYIIENDITAALSDGSPHYSTKAEWVSASSLV
jgi:hypothetical protein